MIGQAWAKIDTESEIDAWFKQLFADRRYQQRQYYVADDDGMPQAIGAKT